MVIKSDTTTKIDWDDLPAPFGGYINMENGKEIIIKFLDNNLNSSPGFQGKGISYQLNVTEVGDNTEKILSTGSLQLMNQLKALLPVKNREIGITMHEKEGFREYDIRTI